MLVRSQPASRGRQGRWLCRRRCSCRVGISGAASEWVKGLYAWCVQDDGGRVRGWYRCEYRWRRQGGSEQSNKRGLLVHG